VRYRTESPAATGSRYDFVLEIAMIPGLRKMFQQSAQYEMVRPINVYLLRLVFILMFFVLGKTAWIHILTHRGPWDPDDAIAGVFGRLLRRWRGLVSSVL
jgi:hypothetical protein